jgi:hypothetical protein
VGDDHHKETEDMFVDKLMALWVIVPVALLSGIVAFWRGKQVLAWYPIPVKGTAGRIVIALVFTVLAVVFGLVAISVYAWVVGRWPDTASQIYLGLGVGLAVLLSIAGVIVRSIVGKGPVVAWTLMNFLWGLGYGGLLPLLLHG